jgi:hypothetical protein
MATHAVTGTLSYSGVTTTTDTDILTLTGFNSTSGGQIAAVRVQNNHATATLLVSTNGVTPAAVGDGVVKILGTTAGAGSGASAVIPVRTRGNGTVEVRLTGSAACDYYVVGLKSY